MSGLEEQRTLHVVGLPFDIKQREIHNLFLPFAGYQKSILCDTHRGNVPFAFVLFESHATAILAKQALCGFQLDARLSVYMKIEFAMRNMEKTQTGEEEELLIFQMTDENLHRLENSYPLCEQKNPRDEY